MMLPVEYTGVTNYILAADTFLAAVATLFRHLEDIAACIKSTYSLVYSSIITYTLNKFVLFDCGLKFS